MKITFLQIDQAFGRVCWGESCRAVARDLGVTEGALRFHFRKGPSPRYVRELAFRMMYADQERDRLNADERAAVDRLVARALAKGAAVTPRQFR
ncbi:hypothetical protein [Polaromonas sp.]|uniref:hypothetical protein n=1 Tax=Polaromonas sp. TaxID=1869339 RepID=UPI003BB6C517